MGVPARLHGVNCPTASHKCLMTAFVRVTRTCNILGTNWLIGRRTGDVADADVVGVESEWRQFFIDEFALTSGAEIKGNALVALNLDMKEK